MDAMLLGGILKSAEVQNGQRSEFVSLRFRSLRDGRAQRTVAVILCAGQGRRMGTPQNKVYLPLAGRPLLAHTLAAFEHSAEVTDILLIAHPDELDQLRLIANESGAHKVIGVECGGETRHQSETCALEALRPQIERGKVAVVLIHDGARPLVPTTDIDALARVARAHGAALLATPLTPGEVVVEVGADGHVAAWVDPDCLWRAQTPQAFEARELLLAYDEARDAGFEGTDTAATYERRGHRVRVVPGSRHNFKVTTPDDLIRAETRLAHRALMDVP